MKILIIDDNPSIHQDFKKILLVSKKERLQEDKIAFYEKSLFDEEPVKTPELPVFAIDTAIQGEEGVAKIKRAFDKNEPYSLAFVDIRMPPGWDGITTIKKIWEIDNNIQIVVCTAYSDYTWEETVSALGERDNLLILKKPFDNVTVRQLACALTKKWELMQETQAYTSTLEHNIKKRTQQLHYQATHDTLTDLPNRTILDESLDRMINKAQREGAQFGVLFLDLDRFKLINDSLSHTAGDEVLRTIAKAFKSLLTEDDLLIRLGGDEFVIVTHMVASVEEIKQIAIDCLEVFSEPLHVQHQDVNLSVSIGIAVYPEDGETKEELLKNADSAMYQAKAQGSNQFQHYARGLDMNIRNRLQQENELRAAINHNEFFLEYQPQFDLNTEEMVSVEALIRWQHPKKGVILPLDFIPLAEDSGLIIPLGEWTIRTACKQIKEWQQKGLAPLRVAINVTTKQIRAVSFPKLIKDILTENELDAKYLELELTENVLINNPDIVKNIHRLKELGIQISLDDFGTGFSGLSCLRDLPIDRLKIDQSYVKNLDEDRGDDIIIESIITMANTFKLEVLAEGVETQKQLDFLKQHRCKEVQGYYFSKPVSAKECEKILQKKAPPKIIV